MPLPTNQAFRRQACTFATFIPIHFLGNIKPLLGDRFWAKECPFTYFSFEPKMNNSFAD
jgi:hypothetical protein